MAFERIHPFQDGNGRVGRLILFRECLKHNIVPFVIEDNLKLFYYRGLKKGIEKRSRIRGYVFLEESGSQRLMFSFYVYSSIQVIG